MTPLIVRHVEVSASGTAPQVESLVGETLGPVSYHPAEGRVFDVSFRCTGVGDLVCWNVRSRSGFVITPRIERDLVGLSWFRAGWVDVYGPRRRAVDWPSPVAVYPISHITRSVRSPGLDLVIAAIEHDDLLRHVRTLTGRDHEGRIEFGSVGAGTSTEKGLRFVLATMAQAVLDDSPLARAPLALASLKDMVLSAVLELCPSNVLFERSRRVTEPAAVRRARDYMAANMSRPIRVGDIAAASGVPLRSLQLAFRAATGQSLVEHLRGLRLERARLDLRDWTWKPHVSEVAFRWGFSNLSDFARRYLEAYGERPSETVRRRREARLDA